MKLSNTLNKTAYISHNATISNIPAYFRNRTQWVVFAVGMDASGKKSKRPVNCAGEYPNKIYAAPDNPASWGTFDDILFSLAYLNANGTKATRFNDWQEISFHPAYCLTEDEDIVAIDLDTYKAPSPEYAEIIINNINSYTERSCSGAGHHIFLHGEFPEWFSDLVDTGAKFGENKWLEVYHSRRFIVMTGDVDEGHTKKLTKAQAPLDNFLESYRSEFTKKNTEQRSVNVICSKRACYLSKNKIFDAISRSKNGMNLITLLIDGKGDQDSPSEMDYSVACRLAFWCNGNGAMVESIMRESALNLDKWDNHPTYLSRTINSAITTCEHNNNFYTKAGKRPVSVKLLASKIFGL